MTNESLPAAEPQVDTWTQALGLGIAAASLSYAVQVNNGNLHPHALIALTVTLVCSVASLAGFRISPVERWGDRPLILLLGGALGFQFTELLTTPPAMYLRIDAQTYQTFIRGIVVAAFLVGAGLSRPAWLGRARMPLLLLLHFLLGIWLIHGSPNPWIDVHVFQRDGVAALLHGQNPYAMTYPDIYGNSSPFYGPGLSVNGRLQFGFPYPPLTLLMAIPGQVLAGDYRYGQLLSLTAAGGLMAYSRGGRVAEAIAALFLFSPRIFFVLEQGWTEPYIVLLLAGVVFCWCRGWKRAVPYGMGLFLGSKQYLAFSAPAVFMLFNRPLEPRAIVRFILRASAVLVAIMLPFVIWGPTAYYKSVVALQVIQPFRTEALDYLSWFYEGTHDLPTPWLKLLAPLAALIVAALGLWRCPRTLTGFCAVTAVTAIAFFAFGKQAFCNHYFFGIGALCLAVAVLSAPRPANVVS